MIQASKAAPPESSVPLLLCALSGTKAHLVDPGAPGRTLCGASVLQRAVAHGAPAEVDDSGNIVVVFWAENGKLHERAGRGCAVNWRLAQLSALARADVH